MGHTVVACTGHPAGKTFRQRVLHAALLKIVNVCRLAGHQLAAHPQRTVGGNIAGFCPQGDGAPGKVPHKVHQCHGAVHCAVGICGGVVQQHIICHYGIVVAKAAQAHPDPHRVPLAADAPLHLHCHTAVIVDLGT